MAERDKATEAFVRYLGQRVEDLDVQYHSGNFETKVESSTYELLACPLHRLLVEMQNNKLDLNDAEQMLRQLRLELHRASGMLGKYRIEHAS